MKTHSIDLRDISTWPEQMTAQQAAMIIGTSAGYVRHMMTEGDVAVIPVAGWRIPKSEVIRLSMQKGNVLCQEIE